MNSISKPHEKYHANSKFRYRLARNNKHHGEGGKRGKQHAVKQKKVGFAVLFRCRPADPPAASSPPCPPPLRSLLKVQRGKRARGREINRKSPKSQQAAAPQQPPPSRHRAEREKPSRWQARGGDGRKGEIACLRAAVGWWVPPPASASCCSVPQPTPIYLAWPRMDSGSLRPHSTRRSAATCQESAARSN